jgi:hypothetical protein
MLAMSSPTDLEWPTDEQIKATIMGPIPLSHPEEQTGGRAGAPRIPVVNVIKIQDRS